jgi:hypothetical protein
MRGGDVRRSVLLAVLAAAAIAAVATVAPRFGGGTERVEAQDGASVAVALDMDITNGSGPCNPIDPEGGSSGDGAEFKVAICLTGAAAPPLTFNIDVLYDDTLDQCVPVDCPGVECLDANPDANAGTTSWTTPDLGTGCDCSIGGLKPPQCDEDPDTGPGKGKAFINCYCDSPTLPVGEGVSSPIAVVTFKSIANGSDTFTFGVVALYDEPGANILRCPPKKDMAPCSGGTRGELAPTSPIPTAAAVPPTDTPNASGTPVPAGPAATAAAATAIALGTPPSTSNPPAGATTTGAKKTPSASPSARPSATPGEAKAEGGGGGTNAGVIAAIVIAVVVVVGGIGWFAYRRFRLR